MSTTSSRALAVLAGAVLVACGPSAEPKSCKANDACGPGALCVQGLCAVNRQPMAALDAETAEHWATYPSRFDASRSADPDSGDAVAGYRWSVTAIDGAECTPYVPKDAARTMEVVFPCPGAFDVGVVVTDSLGLESAPSTVRVTVLTPRADMAPPELPPDPEGAPTVTAGPTVEVDHFCSGTPLSCTTVDGDDEPLPVVLQASAVSHDGGPVTFSWSCDPPPIARAAHLAFSDPAAASPTLTITTDGGAIAGDYRCVVAARDSHGLTGRAVQVVRVGNAVPVFEAIAPVLTARHHSSAGNYVATGSTFPLDGLTDPDGDLLLQPSFRAIESATGSSIFALNTDGFTARYTITTPHSEPASFISHAAKRSIELVVLDVNHGASRREWPIQITDDAPWVKDTVAVADHTFTTTKPNDWVLHQQYEATAELTPFEDPEQDPITSVTSQDPGCSASSLGGGRARVTCVQPFNGTVGLRAFAEGRRVTLTGTDVFGAKTSTTVDFVLRNAGPQVLPFVASIKTQFSYGACCNAGCSAHLRRWIGGAFPVTPQAATDANGDPVQVSVLSATAPASFASGASTTCAPYCGALTVSFADGPEHCTPDDAPTPPRHAAVVRLRYDDGLAWSDADMTIVAEQLAKRISPENPIFPGVVE